MNQTLEPETVEKAPASEQRSVVFSGLHIVVLGYLAAVMCTSSHKVPMRNWGFEYARKAIRIENDLYTASRHRQMIGGKWVNGVRMVVHVDHYKGGTTKRDGFIPFELLTSVDANIHAYATVLPERP